MTKQIQKSDAATDPKTAMKINALKAELIKMQDEVCSVVFNVYPFDPYYGLSAVVANEVCEEVLGKGKYTLYEADGLIAGLAIEPR